MSASSLYVGRHRACKLAAKGSYDIGGPYVTFRSLPVRIVEESVPVIVRLLFVVAFLALVPAVASAQGGPDEAEDIPTMVEYRELPPNPEPELAAPAAGVRLAPLSLDSVGLVDAMPADGLAQVIPLPPSIVAKTTNVSLGRAYGYSSRVVSTGRMPVNSNFGWRRDPITGSGRMHTGVDIDCRYGQTVGAAMGGVVYWAARRGGYGNLVVVDHGKGITTFYGHLSSISVVPGQRVVAGQTVGLVGSTGRSTGPHLHYEVRARGCPVNPKSTISIDGDRIYADGKLVDGPAIEGGDEVVATMTRNNSRPEPPEPPLFQNGDTLSNAP